MKNKRFYRNFVYDLAEKFPDKYQVEVVFMATKETFIQIVDKKTGNIEKIISMETLNALPIEEKIKFARGKILYQVAYQIEPIVKIEMKKKPIIEEMVFEKEETVEKPAPKKKEIAKPKKTTSKAKK
jgi:hypothetical protein